MLLRAEIFWIWHLLVCLLSYHLAATAGLDWVLLALYLAGNYAYLAWIRAWSLSTTRCLLTVLLGQLPLLLLAIAAALVLCDVWFEEAVLVILQLATAVIYPLTELFSAHTLLGVQTYLWFATTFLLLQACIMPIILLRMRVYNDPNNSYIEHVDPHTHAELKNADQKIEKTP